MNYRLLGNTGLKVSEIGMGCEGFSEDGFAMTRKLFDMAEEAGVNYFDLYASNPEMRRAVGNAMKGRREKFIVQSHICSIWKNGQYLRTRNLPDVKAGLEEMMELLQTDYLDVGMIHYCDALSDWEEIVNGGVLDYARELKHQGRIRHIGLSSHNPQVALKAVESGGIEVLMFRWKLSSLNRGMLYATGQVSKHRVYLSSLWLHHVRAGQHRKRSAGPGRS
ncbi:MAG: aldo/keto reductase [Selenomonadaceae bacterium]|nr:aldo/keto reductase [Selenomonadaceae bacterium]